MKKFLSLLLSAVIILFGLTFAFADDPEEDLASSSGSSAYSLEEQSFINQADSDTDKDLRTLSVEVVRAAASNYTLDDIYNLLISIYTTYTGRASWAVFDQSVYNLIVNNFSHYDSVSGNTYDVGAMLWIVEQCLIELSNTFVPATAASQPSIYNLIDNINETLSLALVDDDNTPYLVNIYNKLVDIFSGNIDYTSALFYNSVGVAEYASRINSAIVASYNGLHTQLANLDSINSKLTTTNSTLNIKLTTLNTHAQTIEDKIDTQTNTISNDLSSSGAIASNISSLQSDFNNIDWLLGESNNLYALTPEDYANENYLTTNSERSTSFYTFYPSSNMSNNQPFILKVRLPFNQLYNISNNINFKFGYYYNNTFNEVRDFKYLVVSEHDYTMLYIYSDKAIYFLSDLKPTFAIYLQSRGFVNVNRNIIFNYLTTSQNDFFTVYSWFIDSINANIYKKFELLYASDDLITAKEGQQAFEDQVINDFTGSGSAAAKASDAASAKDISSAVSSGLSSGGSVNNSLGVFNTNSGFWGWFSQENSDLINTLSSQNRLRSSGSSSDWVIDDPYQRNAEELQSILGGDR